MALRIILTFLTLLLPALNGCVREPSELNLGDSSMEDLFEKPVITGASVSADYSTHSPGKRLALRYTPLERITTIARSGTPGKDVWKLLKDTDLSDKTLVIAMDFFFWDSTLADSSDSLRALEALVEKTKASRTALLLGSIPELLPGRQPSRALLNQKITSLCKSQSHCRLVNLENIHRQVMRDGYLTIGGKRYTLSQLVPDGLHLSPVAADYLADKLLEAIRS